MRRACIDIGSNTTRLLVADCAGGGIEEIHQHRAFTRIGRDAGPDGRIEPAKIDQLVAVVTEQLRVARALGVDEVAAVATAAVRHAPNRGEVVAAIAARCGLQLRILSAADEARLAFVGAARTLGRIPAGDLGVVDVGGGSSELVVGTAPDQVSWFRSFRVGSGDLADRVLRSDPPSAAEFERAREEIAAAVGGIDVPHPAEAYAVGGSAASMQRLAGPVLGAEAFARSLALLASAPAQIVAARFSLDSERVRLMPAGLLILEAASRLFAAPLAIACGGVREGVLLEAGE